MWITTGRCSTRCRLPITTPCSIPRARTSPAACRKASPAAGDRDSSAVRRGIDYLVERQTPDGKWPEEATTGTGFPNVFYLTYAMYRDYFPLMALACVSVPR